MNTVTTTDERRPLRHPRRSERP